VPGFVITGQLDSSATGSTWVAVRSQDDHRFVLKVIPVTDPAQAKALATQQLAVYSRIENEHVVRQHCAIDLADGTLALVLDEVTGGSLAHLLAARGQLTPGETVTTVAPLFKALADLHADGVVHGDPSPTNVLFTADGRPLISDLGLAPLLGRHAGPFDGDPGFGAPELAGGAAASPASDVYALGALGWLCLAGAPPASAGTRPSLATLRPDTPPRLVEVLTSCLAADPAARPSAVAAAFEVFEAAPAESVALVSVSDPAAEITRRIRAAAAPPSTSAPARTKRTRTAYRGPLVIGVAGLLAVVVIGVGATWFLRSPPAAVESLPTSAPDTAPTTTVPGASATRPVTTPRGIADVVSAPGSPRVAPAGLLQALVDARALAYVARTPALLDLVYAPGATRADLDKSNIATALKNGGTYRGLSFVVKDVGYLGGASDTARIRATILTPAYKTGQPDGRTVSHARDILGPCVFQLSLTKDGWRILSLTVPSST
jgi:hypothetical protein